MSQSESTSITVETVDDAFRPVVIRLNTRADVNTMIGILAIAGGSINLPMELAEPCREILLMLKECR
jgi:hypothetical protein